MLLIQCVSDDTRKQSYWLLLLLTGMFILTTGCGRSSPEEKHAGFELIEGIVEEDANNYIIRIDPNDPSPFIVSKEDGQIVNNSFATFVENDRAYSVTQFRVTSNIGKQWVTMLASRGFIYYCLEPEHKDFGAFTSLVEHKEEHAGDTFRYRPQLVRK